MPETPKSPGDVTLELKVVPGASRDRIVGWLGDALKVAVSKPAESGQANVAVCRLIAERLNLAASAVTIIRGATQPRKTIRIVGMGRDEVLASLPPKS